MRIRTEARIPNGDVRRTVPAKRAAIPPTSLPPTRRTVPTPTVRAVAAPKTKFLDKRQAQRFAEEVIPRIVEDTANDIRREFGIEISAKSRAAIGSNALSAILERTRK